MKNGSNQIRPIQSNSLKEKLSDSKKGKQWREDNIDYFADFDANTERVKTYMDDLYQLAEGYINEENYNYVTNPINSTKSRPSKYPSQLRNYDIVSPIVQMLMGEKIKRTIQPIVYAVNSDITTVKEQEERMQIQGQLDQLIINGLNELGLETGFESRDLKTHEQILTEVDSVKDDKAMMGQESLNYILQYNEIYRHMRKSWFDFIAVGSCSSYRDVIRNNTHYESICPKYVTYNCSDNQDFIEDGESACIKLEMTVSEVMDMFYDELEKKDLELLEESYNLINGSKQYVSDAVKEMYTSFQEDGTIANNFSNTVQVSYVNWKSLVDVGKVKTIDISGNEIEYEVEEGFIGRPDEEIVWNKVNQLWEGFRISLNDGVNHIYLRIRPVPHSRAEFDNPSKCKLLINGRNIFSRNYRGKSIVQKLEPYQDTYNILHWHMEKLINKNKDKIVILPSDLVPDNKDMEFEDMLYFADADGLLILEGDLNSSQMQQLNAIKVLDLSLSQYISYIRDLLVSVKTEAEEMLGITRQRKGNVTSSDGKGTTEQAIFQSSIMTEEYFTQFEEFEARDYACLLDLSKNAWIDGKKATYVNSDKRTVYMNIQGSKHKESEYGIFVGNTSDEKEEKDIIKSNVQNFIQNGMTPDVVTKLLTSSNLEEMNDIVEINQVQVMQQQQQQIEQQQQHEAQLAQMSEESKVKDLQFKYDELASKEMIAMLQLEESFRSAATTTDDSSTTTKYLEEANKLMIAREQMILKRQEIASKERMNTENNKVKLKNPVAGERK